jgi:isocitrate/isopropylmalate dehydrogenase
VSRTAAVACVTGVGTAPELMAEAVLALDAVGRLHGLQIDDTHVSFGGVALARAGQAVPAATRSAILGADAVLVAGAGEPALDEVMSELDLRAELTCVRFGSDGALAFVTPLEESATEWAIEVAFRIAESRSMRLSSVGDAPWNDVVDEVASRHEHVRVEHLAPRVAIPLAAFEASRFDVVAVAPAWAEPMVEIAAAPSATRVSAHGRLSEHGPSLFVPSPDDGFASGGHGVVNPSSMLLAAAMMLEHGLDAPAPAATLARAVSAALVGGRQTPDLLRFGVGATSREFTSRVVAGFHLALANAEFWVGAA